MRKQDSYSLNNITATTIIKDTVFKKLRKIRKVSVSIKFINSSSELALLIAKKKKKKKEKLRADDNLLPPDGGCSDYI